MDEPIYFSAGEADQAPIVMLHGTGGVATDLLPIANEIAPKSPKIGISGRVIEAGKRRYFKHAKDGQFDHDSIEQETDWLLETIEAQAKAHHLVTTNMIVLGFSSGANIAAYAWLNRQPFFKTAILLHPVQLATDQTVPDLRNFQLKAFATYGEHDPLVSLMRFDGLVDQLATAGINVYAYRADQSHAVSRSEVLAAKEWLAATDRLTLPELA